MDHDQQQQAQRIYNNMAFAPDHLFMDIYTPFFTTFGRFHTLAVNDTGARLRFSAFLPLHLLQNTLL